MLYSILNQPVDENTEKLEKEKALERLRLKVRGVGKMLKMFSALRQERENVVSVSPFAPQDKLPEPLISENVESIKEAVGDFQKSKSTDKFNEKRPPVPSAVSAVIAHENQRVKLIRSQSLEKLKTLKN